MKEEGKPPKPERKKKMTNWEMNAETYSAEYEEMLELLEKLNEEEGKTEE